MLFFSIHYFTFVGSLQKYLKGIVYFSKSYFLNVHMTLFEQNHSCLNDWSENSGLQLDQIGRFIGLWDFLKSLATIILPKSPTFLGNFSKVVKIYHFSSEIIFGQLLQTFGDFFLVTLIVKGFCQTKHAQGTIKYYNRYIE